MLPFMMRSTFDDIPEPEIMSIADDWDTPPFWYKVC